MHVREEIPWARWVLAHSAVGVCQAAGFLQAPSRQSSVGMVGAGPQMKVTVTVTEGAGGGTGVRLAGLLSQSLFSR